MSIWGTNIFSTYSKPAMKKIELTNHLPYRRSRCRRFGTLFGTIGQIVKGAHHKFYIDLAFNQHCLLRRLQVYAAFLVPRQIVGLKLFQDTNTNDRLYEIIIWNYQPIRFQLSGVPFLTAWLTLLPSITSRYFGGRPCPGRIQRTLSGVSISPGFKFLVI